MMSRAQMRRESRQAEKGKVVRNMTVAQMQKFKEEMAEVIASELLMKVFGIAALVLHDKYGMLMKKEVDGKSREERFLDECAKVYKSFSEGLLTLEDIQQVLEEECGVVLKIEHPERREWM